MSHCNRVDETYRIGGDTFDLAMLPIITRQARNCYVEGLLQEICLDHMLASGLGAILEISQRATQMDIPEKTAVVDIH